MKTTADECFWDYYFVLFSTGLSEKNNFSEAVTESYFTKLELPSSRSCKVAGFQQLVAAARYSILDAAWFLDPPLAFTYRKKDGYFTLITNAFSVRKVYIDFWMKIWGSLSVNGKQILMECFKSFLKAAGLFEACICYFFHQMVAVQKLWKMLFISSEKLYS